MYKMNQTKEAIHSVEITASIKALQRVFPSWDITEREDAIRMARYFKFEEVEAMRGFNHDFGSMMRTQSVFVLCQPFITKNNTLLIALRLTPLDSSLIAAHEIVRYIEEQYEAARNGATAAA